MLRTVVKDVLWLAFEESELYQVIWELNTRYPNRSEAEKREIAKETVFKLVQKGWITLNEFIFPSGQKHQMSTDQADIVLEEESSWGVPIKGNVAYMILLTDLGESQITTRNGDQDL